MQEMPGELVHPRDTGTNRRAARLHNLRMAKAADNSTVDAMLLTGGVRVDEVVLVTVALAIWLVSIVLFVRRWTRLRVLEPLQARPRYSPKNMDRVRIVHNPRYSIIYHTCSRRMSETLQARQSQSLRRTLESQGTQGTTQLSPTSEVPPNVTNSAMTSSLSSHSGSGLLLTPPATTNGDVTSPDGAGGPPPEPKKRASSKYRGSIASSVFRRKLTTESPQTTPGQSPAPSRPQSPVTLQLPPNSMGNSPSNEGYIYMVPPGVCDKHLHDDIDQVTASSPNLDLRNSATSTLTGSLSASCLNGNSQTKNGMMTSESSVMSPSPSPHHQPIVKRKIAWRGKSQGRNPKQVTLPPATDSLLRATVIKAAISLATDKHMLI